MLWVRKIPGKFLHVRSTFPPELYVHMRTTLSLSGLLILASLSFTASSAEWKPYEVGPGVTVEFPSEPTPGSKGRVRYLVYEGEQADIPYKMAVITTTAPAGMIKNETDAAEAYDDLVEGAAETGTITQDSVVQVEGVRSRKILIQDPDGLTTTLLITYKGGHLYTLMVSSADGLEPIQPTIDKFFDSINLGGATSSGVRKNNPEHAIEEDSLKGMPDPRALGRAMANVLVPCLGIALVIFFFVSRRKKKRQ